MPRSRSEEKVAESTAGADEALTLQEAADLLGVHYMTAYRYVRTGRLDATRHGGQWVVPKSAIGSLRAPAAPGRKRLGAPTQRHYTAELAELLITGDEPEAWRLAQRALASAYSPEQLYVEVLAPAMGAVGDAWAHGRIDVADEHRASTVISRLIGRLGPLFIRHGQTRGFLVLGTASGDRHGLSTALLADPLRGRGFAVADLGADTPPASFAVTCAKMDRVLAVGIAASVVVGDDVLVRTIEAIRAARDVPILLGGGGVGGAAHAAALGADAYTATATDALAWFEQVVRP
jgi:excisionase family DNA binding protein